MLKLEKSRPYNRRETQKPADKSAKELSSNRDYTQNGDESQDYVKSSDLTQQSSNEALASTTPPAEHSSSKNKPVKNDGDETTARIKFTTKRITREQLKKELAEQAEAEEHSRFHIDWASIENHEIIRKTRDEIDQSAFLDDPECQKFLEVLRHPGTPTYFCQDTPNGNGLQTVWLTGGMPAIRKNAKFIYFLPNSLGEKPEKGRGGNKDIQVVHCLFADFDKKMHDDSLEACLEVMKKAPLPPTSVTFTGNGYHGYWIFANPFIIENETDHEYIRDLQARWPKLVGADPAASDLARILRVPGTFNCKEANGPNFPQCQLLTDVDESLRNRSYSIEQLAALLPERDTTKNESQGMGQHKSALIGLGYASELTKPEYVYARQVDEAVPDVRLYLANNYGLSFDHGHRANQCLSPICTEHTGDPEARSFTIIDTENEDDGRTFQAATCFRPLKDTEGKEVFSSDGEQVRCISGVGITDIVAQALRRDRIDVASEIAKEVGIRPFDEWFTNAKQNAYNYNQHVDTARFLEIQRLVNEPTLPVGDSTFADMYAITKHMASFLEQTGAVTIPGDNTLALPIWKKEGRRSTIVGYVLVEEEEAEIVANCSVKDCYIPMGGIEHVRQVIKRTGEIAIAQSIETAIAIAPHTHAAVVCAIVPDNTASLTKSLEGFKGKTKVTIYADNHHEADDDGIWRGNPGLENAIAAAKPYNYSIAFPPAKDGVKTFLDLDGPTDNIPFENSELGRTMWSRGYTQRLNKQYVESEDLLGNYRYGEYIIGVSTARGTGKSTAAKGVSDYFKAQDLSVAHTSHLRSLSGNASTLFGIESHLDHNSHSCDDETRKWMSSCTPVFTDLCWFPKNGPNLLILDEVCAQMDSYVDGVVAKKDAPKTYRNMVETTHKAKTALLMDADLDERHFVHFIQGYTGPFVYITNDYQPEAGREIELVDQVELMSQFIEALKEGKRCLVSTDSKSQAKTLFATINKYAPDKENRIISSEYATENREFIRQIPNGSYLYVDNIVHTPSMGTGVSLDTPHFERHFAFYTGAVTTSTQFQGLSRDRNWTKITAYVAKRGVAPSNKTRDEFITDTRGTVLRQLDEISTDIQRAARDMILYDHMMYHAVMADKRLILAVSKRAPRARFKAKAISEGIEIVDNSKAGADPDDILGATDQLRKEFDMRIAELGYALHILDPMDEGEAESFKNSDDGTYKDYLRYVAYDCEQFYIERVTPELIYMDMNSQRGPAMRLRGLAFSKNEKLLESAETDLTDGVDMTGVDTRHVERLVTRKIFGMMGVAFSADGSAVTVDEDTVWSARDLVKDDDFIQLLLDNAEVLNSLEIGFRLNSRLVEDRDLPHIGRWLSTFCREHLVPFSTKWIGARGESKPYRVQWVSGLVDLLERNAIQPIQVVVKKEGKVADTIQINAKKPGVRDDSETAVGVAGDIMLTDDSLRKIIKGYYRRAKVGPGAEPLATKKRVDATTPTPIQHKKTKRDGVEAYIHRLTGENPRTAFAYAYAGWETGAYKAATEGTGTEIIADPVEYTDLVVAIFYTPELEYMLDPSFREL